MEWCICYYDAYQTIDRYTQNCFDSEKLAEDEIKYFKKQGNDVSKLFVITYSEFLEKKHGK